MQSVKLNSTITCPECGHSKTEKMPTNACQWFYECESCKVLLKPLKVIAAFSVLMELLNAHQFKKDKIAVIANRHSHPTDLSLRKINPSACRFSNSKVFRTSKRNKVYQ